MEKDAAKSVRYFEALFRALPMPAMVVNHDLLIWNINPGAEEFLAMGKRRALNRRTGDTLGCLNAESAPAGCGSSEDCSSCVVRDSIQQAMSGGSVTRRHAEMVVTRQGATRPLDLLITTSPFDFEGGIYVLIIMEDITEQLNDQRLKGVLETAGAAAHELSQPLQVIMGETEMMLEDLEEGSPLRDTLGLIKITAERMRLVMSKLQNITRYVSTDYVGRSRIIDLDKASGRGPDPEKDQ